MTCTHAPHVPETAIFALRPPLTTSQAGRSFTASWKSYSENRGLAMAVTLGHNQYGKAENRVVRVFRDSEPHEIVDYNVSVALWGGQEAPHLTGDNAPTLPTDTQKNTVYSFAKEAGDAVRQPESFGIRLARHFVDNTAPITHARVKLEMYPWTRLDNPHAFVRDGRYVRTATV